MIAKLIVEGEEFDIEILDPNIQKLIAPKKKTGYERVKYYDDFFANYHNSTTSYTDKRMNFSNQCYDCADYYSDKTVAENNNRADALMRKLRRFAVEHRTKDDPTEKYYINYVKQVGLQIMRSDDKYIGPWFDTLHNASVAIETFRDELTWYFTEYEDSL